MLVSPPDSRPSAHRRLASASTSAGLSGSLAYLAVEDGLVSCERGGVRGLEYGIETRWGQTSERGGTTMYKIVLLYIFDTLLECITTATARTIHPSMVTIPQITSYPQFALPNPQHRSSPPHVSLANDSGPGQSGISCCPDSRAGLREKETP